METFRIEIQIENPARPGERCDVSSVLERWTGPAFVYAAGTTATDDVVFGEATDRVLLGARSLEGLNLRVDSVSKRLVDAGPVPAMAV